MEIVKRHFKLLTFSDKGRLPKIFLEHRTLNKVKKRYQISHHSLILLGNLVDSSILFFIQTLQSIGNRGKWL